MNLWHKFTDWFVSDFYTLEERELMREEARRLRLKTDLQEARINRRKKLAEQERLVAVWRFPHKRWDGGDWRRVVSCVEMHTTKRTRVLRATVMTAADGAIVERIRLNDFLTTQPEYQRYLQRWLDGSIGTRDLKKCANIEVF